MTVTALEIATGAMRYVGAFAPYDVTPDQSELAVTLEQLDSLLAEKVGTEALWFFVPVTEDVVLESGVGTYNLNSVTTNDFQFVREVQLLFEGEEQEVELIRRERYEELRGSDELSDGQVPLYVYIERKDNPKMIVLPTPDRSDYTLKMWGQKYSPDVTQSGGVVDIEFPKAWKRSITLETAIDIGSGPVVQMQENEFKRLAALFSIADKKLKSFNNRSNVRRARHTKPREF